MAVTLFHAKGNWSYCTVTCVYFGLWSGDHCLLLPFSEKSNLCVWETKTQISCVVTRACFVFVVDITKTCACNIQRFLKL